MLDGKSIGKDNKNKVSVAKKILTQQKKKQPVKKF